MLPTSLSENSKAILLLCGIFGDKISREGIKPFTIPEYNRIAAWLNDHDLQPSDLLDGSIREGLINDAHLKIDSTRLTLLFERAGLLGLLTEKWQNKGIGILTRADELYPSRLKERHGVMRPPILYVVGDLSILNNESLAIVGSRNVDGYGEIFTREVAEHCVADNMIIVSGGARGVDRISMETALENHGSVIGVMADSLLRAALSKRYREAILDQRLLLMSPFNPEAGFSAGNAMARNKYVYSLATYALVIAAETGKGGTWAGATEELKRPDPHPVFVRNDVQVPDGNIALIDKGAIAFPAKPWETPLHELLQTTWKDNRKSSVTGIQGSLQL